MLYLKSSITFYKQSKNFEKRERYQVKNPKTTRQMRPRPTPTELKVPGIANRPAPRVYNKLQKIDNIMSPNGFKVELNKVTKERRRKRKGLFSELFNDRIG